MMKIERTSFNRYVEENVFNTINAHGLIKENDRIMVAVSGGKDSILTLHMVNKYRKKSGTDFGIEAVCIDEGISGYREKGIETARENCDKLDIPLTVVSFEEEWNYCLDDIHDFYKSTCMPCGVYRRYLLNKVSDDHDCDKIATGHNMDDEIQSFLMTFSRNDRNKFPKFGPKLDRIHRNLIPRIKPLWNLPEKDVGIWCVVNDIPIHDEECPYSVTSLRSQVKLLLNEIEEKNRGTKKRIFESFMKTFNVKQEDVELGLCECCSQPTAKSPCKACEITEDIRARLQS
ncbi:MAG: TIGR00269 family protein [Methanosphaera sp. rholeuAM270]|nr:MAG: TIGR00269 family protein [Methanosphaera sp. rholeuAM270]